MEFALEYFSSNWGMLVVGAFLGLGVGVLTGLFGAGGGFIITPVLNIFLGLPMAVAIGTSSANVVGASGFAMIRQLDKKLFGIRVALCMGIGIPLGAFLGKNLVEKTESLSNMTFFSVELAGRSLSDFILLSIFIVFLSLISGWMFIDNFILRKNKIEDESKHKGYLGGVKLPPLMTFRTIPSGEFSIPILVVLGFIMGFMGGLLGIGGGVLMMPILFYMVGQTTKMATQTDLMVVFVTGVSSTIVHALAKTSEENAGQECLGNINYFLVVFLVFGSFFGTRIGTWIRSKISGKSIRKYFVFIVIAATILIVWKVGGMVEFWPYPVGKK